MFFFRLALAVSIGAFILEHQVLPMAYFNPPFYSTTIPTFSPFYSTTIAPTYSTPTTIPNSSPHTNTISATFPSYPYPITSTATSSPLYPSYTTPYYSTNSTLINIKQDLFESKAHEIDGQLIGHDVLRLSWGLESEYRTKFLPFKQWDPGK
ncbi:hypothetical protein QL285_073153 [Trifolium repens]|nr:hypothetical protein QL285_073153 [Trifolium repens]